MDSGELLVSTSQFTSLRFTTDTYGLTDLAHPFQRWPNPPTHNTSASTSSSTSTSSTSIHQLFNFTTLKLPKSSKSGIINPFTLPYVAKSRIDTIIFLGHLLTLLLFVIAMCSCNSLHTRHVQEYGCHRGRRRMRVRSAVTGIAQGRRKDGRGWEGMLNNIKYAAQHATSTQPNHSLCIMPGSLSVNT